MSLVFRLHPAHPIEHEIRRVVLELIDDAREQLCREGNEVHAGVHQARKDLKKIRAVLRLVRASLGDSYATEKSCFRDLGRALASSRDREAMIEAFEALRSRDDFELGADLTQRTREYLISRRDELASSEAGFDENRSMIRVELETARVRVSGWKIHGEGFSAIEKGVRRGLGAVRRTGREALAEPGPENFHEWRKRTKVHWYHTRLLADVWGRGSEEWRLGLGELSEILGEDQDLQMLIELADSGIPHYTRVESDHLRQLLRRRQDRLRDEAAQKGAPYLAQEPRAFTARVRDAWLRASDQD